ASAWSPQLHAIRMETIARVVGTAIVCITAVFNYLTDVFLTQPLKATIQHLEETDLTTLSGENRSLKAKSLWESSGAVIMAVRRPG
uniref:Redox-regulatory protein FAM213A n=1 Tax=Gadus morhua TaxID=8049 RepID=A0A8C4ZEB6_GADMO